LRSFGHCRPHCVCLPHSPHARTAHKQICAPLTCVHTPCTVWWGGAVSLCRFLSQFDFAASFLRARPCPCFPSNSHALPPSSHTHPYSAMPHDDNNHHQQQLPPPPPPTYPSGAFPPPPLLASTVRMTSMFTWGQAWDWFALPSLQESVGQQIFHRYVRAEEGVWVRVRGVRRVRRLRRGGKWGGKSSCPFLDSHSLPPSLPPSLPSALISLRQRCPGRPTRIGCP